MTTIGIEAARQPEVLEFLRQGDEYTLSLYPAEFCYLLNVDELEESGVSVFVARIDGAAVGMAALVDHGDGSGELKRMFVSEDARGNGVGGGLLAALEARAIAAGVRILQLETGPLQHSAIALYERHGFERIPNFGDYVSEEYSVCYEKTL